MVVAAYKPYTETPCSATKLGAYEVNLATLGANDGWIDTEDFVMWC